MAAFGQCETIISRFSTSEMKAKTGAARSPGQLSSHQDVKCGPWAAGAIPGGW